MKRYAEPIKVKGMVHSHKKEGPKDVLILGEFGENQYVAEYNSVKCTAIWNVFNGLYYLDDVYGIIHDENLLHHFHS